ncbi:hypothetical protein [Alteromonas lipolytica]|uniref:Uncharacterized protein n=1 Tax=Alteromonas lipolytica TaxID=1856405 RepID=A0A1E8FKC7_9ALTE|nr:hypothetical protein [Alteromonas lipolytica]OFI36068.1 hypothetical protein BFC17_10400 [Alteromonas lipolytica]GGF71230.1 hypothetical protein GCM10011338_24260 [Alteromonas lipolytica]
MISYVGESVHIELLGRLPSSWLLPLAILLIVCGVVSIGLVFNRLKLRKGRLVLVTGLNLLAWLLLVAILSPVQLRDDEPRQTVLVTASAAPLSEALFADIKPDASLWFTQDAWLRLSQTTWLQQYDIQRPNIVREPEDIIWAEPQLQHLRVVGDGLTAQQWQRLSHRKAGKSSAITVSLDNVNTVTGPVSMRWHRRLSRAQWQHASGVLQVAPGQSEGNLQQTLYQVQLKDPAGQVVAQQTVRDGEAFDLVVNVKTEGLWLYQLQLFNALSEQPVADETVAFEVSRPTLAKLLIRQSAPSFETRHLKNWAVEQGAQLTVETQISKNRYISEHANYPQGERSNNNAAKVDSLDSLSALNQYDLVIMDSRSLINLTDRQKGNLESAVKGGLGVLVIGDSTLFTENTMPALLDAFQIRRNETGNSDQSLLSWQFDRAGVPLNVLPAEISTRNGFSLVRGADGRVVAPGTYYGLGKVAISLTNKTHQWRTAGLAPLFSRYWHYLIEKLARQSGALYVLPIEDGHLTQVRQPLAQCFAANTDLQRDIDSYAFGYQGPENTPIALLPQVDEVNQNLACSTVYPAYSGWQHTHLSNAAETVSQSFYVYNPNDWKAWQQQLKQTAGQRFLRANPATANQSVWSELSLWPFWWGLLLVCSLLWIERKF